MYRQLITGVAMVVSIVGCQKGKEAQVRLERAREMYEIQQFAAAKNELDSIHTLHPREIAIRKEALTLMRMVERGESERNIVYCDSILPIRMGELEDLKKGFVFEKNPEYDQSGKYIWSTMTIERNVERSYIRCGVNEEGEMYVASVYFGRSPLGHTGLHFSTNSGTFAQTPAIPYDGGTNYRFEDMGNTTEVVTYRGANCRDIASFITFVDEKERVKATYTGGKPFSLYLSDTDKKAIRATYELALVLTEIDTLQRAREKAEMKMMLIDLKLAE